MNRSKRILFITQWFDPEPTFKGLAFARELVRLGFEVEVVTGFPNYPSGKLYPGFHLSLIQREFIEGVRVTRVPLYPNHDQSSLKRIFNYLSFAVSASIYSIFFARRPDVIYSYHPPLTVGLAACLIKFLRRTPVVYDIQDMWPDTLRATGMLNNAIAISIVSLFCQFVYRHMDHIVVLSPGFKSLLIQRNVCESKITVIYNWADESSLSSSTGFIHRNFPGDDHFRILFAGNIGYAQALDSVLDAASFHQSSRSRVSWIFLGEGIDLERLKLETKKRKLNNVVFLPAVPMSDVGLYLHSSDALLVHLRSDPLFEVTIPSKTQAYMAAGKPLLMAVDGDASDLVLKARAGIVAKSDNPYDLFRASQQLATSSKESLDTMGKNASCFYRNNLSLREGVQKFAYIFSRLAT